MRKNYCLMTPPQLRQWSFENSQTDQWWLCLDSVTQEIPCTVADIEERLKSGDYSTVQALHVSQAGLENAPWVEVIMPPVIIEPLSVWPPVDVVNHVAAATPASAASNAAPEVSEPDETLGIIILLLPLIGIFLMWYSPVESSLQLAALSVVSTAILVGIEANKLGIGKNRKFDEEGMEKSEYGPVAWAVFVMLFWIIGFPSYMYWRSRYGAKNMLIGGIGVAVLFLTITIMIDAMPFPTNDLVNQPQRQILHEDHGHAEDLETQADANLDQINRKVARDSMEQYEITRRSGTAMDRYVQACLVAAAFLQAKDEINYRKWKSIERVDGIAAGILTDDE
jgi:hypothetical protein